MSKKSSQENGRKDQDQTPCKHQVPKESSISKRIRQYKWGNQLWTVTS
jgi:hypothetical protein